MKEQGNKIDPLVIQNKSCKRYFFVEEKKVYFNADFDSGNLEKVQQISPYIYKLYPGYDKTRNSTEKTFFHFKVCGFHMCTVRFHVTRVHILEKLIKTDQVNVYRPIVKKEQSPYQQLKKNIKIYYNSSDEVQLSFQYEFQSNSHEWIEFSFTYPYSYGQCCDLINQLREKYSIHDEIYFHDEVLAHSKENKKLFLLTVTEKMNCQTKEREKYVDKLFPDQNPRPFKINKPKIIISGRIHPGETPSSYCIEGLLRFLLDEKDYRSYLLRKNFHFIILPMLNPDGVYSGMFRNDINGDNLNRMYKSCSRSKHPTIWSFREYLNSLQKQCIAFYFDFHAHPSRKQFFIYGNAFSQITQQVEAETFGKLLELNCPYFHNIDSIFSEQQMTAKDKNDSNNKEGCGRVYVHKLFNLIHSYTVQCGYFAPAKINSLLPVDPHSINSDNYCYVNTWEKCAQKTYKPESYMLMGKSILVTVLDLFHLNPYTRINQSQYRSISNIRKNVAAHVYSISQRFKMMDGHCPKKMRQLTQLIQENYYKAKFGPYGLSVSESYGFKKAKRNFSLLSKVYLPRKYPTKKSPSKEGNNQKRQLTHHESEQNQVSENPFLETVVKRSSAILLDKRTQKNYKSEKKLKKPQIIHDLYHLDEESEEKIQQMESLVLVGGKVEKKDIGLIMQEDEKSDFLHKRKSMESDPNFRKSRLEHFINKESHRSEKFQILHSNLRHLPIIKRKLLISKSGEKIKQTSNLPALIIQRQFLR